MKKIIVAAAAALLAVGGATLSSEGIKAAVKDALSKAQ